MFPLMSKINICSQRNLNSPLIRNIFTASVNPSNNKLKTQNGIFSKWKGLFDKPSDYLPYYGTKRNATGPHVPNPPPPVRKPNTPGANVKRDKQKGDKKPTKPTMYVKEGKCNVSPAQERTVEEIKKILRHKWGVKLVKDVAPPKTDETEPAPAGEVTKKSLTDDRVLLGIVNKTDAELANTYIKRTRGNNFRMDKIAVKQTIEPDESTAMNTEYYVPVEVKEGEESKLWKNAAAKSTRRAMETGLTPAELQIAESIFIRPEPPASKSDEKGIKTPDL